jgi:DNA-binding NarL/FixJ family response regulator
MAIPFLTVPLFVHTFQEIAKGTTDMHTETPATPPGHLTEAIKILLFSKCKLRYLGLYYICSEYKEFTLLGSAETLTDESLLLAGLQPDLLIIDQALFTESVFQPDEILRGFRQIARILIIADQIDLTFACTAIASGIDGYLLTSATQSEMLQTLRTIAGGGSWLELRFVKMLVERMRHTPEPEIRTLPGARQLSEREQQVLHYLAEGYTCKEVARELYLSESSVRTYWYRIMNKLNAVNRAEAIMIASRTGLLDHLDLAREVATCRRP